MRSPWEQRKCSSRGCAQFAAQNFHGLHNFSHTGFNRNAFGDPGGWNRWGGRFWGAGWNNWGWGWGGFWPFLFGDIFSFAAVYYDPFWPLVRISFSSASSPPGPYFGPDYGYAPDYTGYLDSPDICYGGGKAAQGCAASPSQMGRFETQWLAIKSNLCALTNLSGQWIDLVHRRRPPRGIVLDIVPAMSTAPATGSAWDS